MATKFTETLFAAGLVLALAACDAAPGTDTTADAAPAGEGISAADELPADGPVPAGTDDADGVDHAASADARWEGVGPATFGMTADEVRAAWDGDLGDIPAEDAACFHLSPTGQPDYAYFAMMFGEGRFVRYSVSNDAMTAPGGGRRGMSADAIERLYPGAVERQPHKYTDGEYLRIIGEGDQVLVFETDGSGTVTEWRVGVPPYVDYVEGCA